MSPNSLKKQDYVEDIKTYKLSSTDILIMHLARCTSQGFKQLHIFKKYAFLYHYNIDYFITLSLENAFSIRCSLLICYIV